MTLLEVLEPIDLTAFTECSGHLGDLSIRIAKITQEPAPTWTMPPEPDPSTGEMRPFDWKPRVVSAFDQTLRNMTLFGLGTGECNISFPIDGIAYTLIVTISKAAKAPPVELKAQASAKTLRRLQKRATGGQ